MKKFFFVMLFIGAVNICAVTPSPRISGPAITFESELIDMGNIRQGSNAVCEFKFTNTGTAPLIILSVKGQCGCTTFPESWPKEPIAPGAKASFKVKYDTSVRVGQFDKKILVQTNASEALLEVKIKGVVLPAG